jgi:hypothetical protein
MVCHMAVKTLNSKCKHNFQHRCFWLTFASVVYRTKCIFKRVTKWSYARRIFAVIAGLLQKAATKQMAILRLARREAPRLPTAAVQLLTRTSHWLQVAPYCEQSGGFLNIHLVRYTTLAMRPDPESTWTPIVQSSP